jgi:hypothetical protein
LYYFGARYFASWLGRWISVDPGPSVKESQYAYVANNPVGLIDPDGREPICPLKQPSIKLIHDESEPRNHWLAPPTPTPPLSFLPTTPPEQSVDPSLVAKYAGWQMNAERQKNAAHAPLLTSDPTKPELSTEQSVDTDLLAKWDEEKKNPDLDAN